MASDNDGETASPLPAPAHYTADHAGSEAPAEDVDALRRELERMRACLAQVEQAYHVGEAWLLTTLKSIGDAVIATDQAGCVEFLNAAAERVTGWALADARGRPIEDLFELGPSSTFGTPRPQTAPRSVRPEPSPTSGTPGTPMTSVRRVGALHPLRRVLAENAAADQGDACLLRRDGSAIVVDHSAAPIRSADGHAIGAVLVLRDVTEKHRAEERRRFLAEASWALASMALDYEGTLRRVAEIGVPLIADWCFVDLLESDGSINRAAVAHVDPTAARIARELTRRHPPRAGGTAAVHRAVKTGEPQLANEIIEQMIAAAGDDVDRVEALGRLGPGSAMIVPLRSRDRALGALTFVCAESGRSFGADDPVLAMQFANGAALAVEGALLYREAQRVNRMKDEFLANLSHELRTPLNAILGWARLSRTGKLDAKGQARALETIERNAHAQAQLIEDLLDVSRIISGKFRVEPRAVELRQIIEAAVDAVRLAADARGIELRCRVEPVSQISGDATRLQQVVWNLVSNAIKFTPRGGHVDLWLHEVDAHAEIEVRDDGQGIPPEFLPFVFDRFRQLDGTTTRAHSGLGLGLAIVRHLVELHGGSVRADSGGEGHGSTFTVKLPIAAARPRTEEPGDPEPASVEPRSFGAPPTLTGLRVLVVDDETDARELVAMVLTEHGAGVTAVGSVPEALQAIEIQKPDVLVSDIGMPSEDGYTLIRKVKQMEPRVGRIPAAALTAYAGVQDRTRALLAGYSSHLAKPIEPAELAAVVARLAGRGQKT